jgi:PDZ domain
VRLTAVTRPPDIDVQQTVEFGYSVEMVDTWVRAMDSLRIELVRGGRGQTVQVRFMDEDGNGQQVRVRSSAPRTGGGAPRADGGVSAVVADGNGRSVQAPFEFFVFRGEDHDSLRNEMVDLNRVMDELQGRLVAREVEVREGQGRNDVRLREDEEFVRLSRLLEQASSRSTGLETAMAVSAREKAGLEYTQRLPGIRGVVTLDRPAPQPDFRPLTPYLLGRNRVAGAEVTDLEPQLAEYFDVGGGVLVLGVAEGTPAALAGIVPGDVIVRLDQVTIRSVEDLRFGVSMAGETLPVSLIRQGASVQVLLRRQ